MKTKYLIHLALTLPLLLNACGILSPRGSGNILTEAREVHDFDRVIVSGTSELNITQGEVESLAITTDDNLVRYIESEVRDGTLYLRNKEGISPSQPIQYKLSIKNVVALDISGIVGAEIGDIVTEHLDIVVSGMSTLQMGNLDAQKMSFHLNGSTKVELTGSGETVEQRILMNGSNIYYAPEIRSQSVDISASGSNDATVWATDFLNIEISGIGNVDYYGSSQVTQSGSGNISINGLGIP